MPEKFDRAAFEKLTAGQEKKREELTEKQAGERGAFMAGAHEQANKNAAALSELARKAEEIKKEAQRGGIKSDIVVVDGKTQRTQRRRNSKSNTSNN